MTGIAHVYRYAAPSARVGGRFALCTSAPAGIDVPFVRGRLLQPRATADWLLTVAAIVRSRFFVPPAMREKQILLADPVVTVDGNAVRCEGFSSCCGVYARLDMDGEAFAAGERSFGTTNVDFGEPMRAALTALRDGEVVELQVGQAGVELQREGQVVVERRVELPSRWVRGFAEVQAVQAGLQSFGSLATREALALVRALPRTRASGWLVRGGPSYRLSPTASGAGLRIGGAERLRVVEPVLRHATAMQLFGRSGAAEAPFGVVLARPGLALTIVLSPAPWRGFSGEGALLRDLVRPVAATDIARWRAALSWREPAAAAAGDDDRAALARLALDGSAGFALAAGTYFRRELPFERAALAELQPRLVAARELVAAGGVRRDGATAEVDSGEARYRLQRRDDGEWLCTCPWFAKARGQQGPCKHVLAVELVAVEEES